MAADLIRIAGFVTPLGPFAVAVSPSGVVATGTPDRLPEALGEAGLHFAEDPDGLPEIGADLDAYFAGRIRGLPEPVDLRLAPTPFIRQVLEVACRIPYGELRTYGDVASEAGHPRAARAVGSALRRSPIEVFVPCHRVVPSGPGWGSYGGEDDRRLRLLRLEGAV